MTNNLTGDEVRGGLYASILLEAKGALQYKMSSVYMLRNSMTEIIFS